MFDEKGQDGVSPSGNDARSGSVAAFSSTREVIVKSERFAAAKAFYADVLGFKRILDEDEIVGFETGSFALYVEAGSAEGPVFEIECVDVESSVALLLRAGCEIVEDDPSIPRLYVRDPFGLTFNLRAEI